jgi:Rv2525c-like, glycoside hydrolase-like domain
VSTTAKPEPTLPGSVPVAPVQGFDTDTPLTATTALAFVTAGFGFAIRYLPLDSQDLSGVLTYAEAVDILENGLALMAVQHVMEPPWKPCASLGQQYGSYAAAYAGTVGFPSGVCIWLDLEGVETGTDPSNVIDYCNAWYQAVKAAGYIPGIYVGYDSILSGDQLYQDLSFQYYWKSGSKVPDVSVRGYCMLQNSASAVLCGVSYDRDDVQSDNLGHVPYWLVMTPTAPIGSTDAAGY